MEIVASCELHRKIHIWDLNSGDVIARLEGHTKPAMTVSFTSCGTLMASGSFDCKIIVWDCQTWTKIQTFIGHSKGISSVSFNEEGNCIASTSYDGTVRVWSLESNMKQLKIDTKDECMRFVTFNHNGDAIVVSVNNRLCMYDAHSGELKWRLTSDRKVRFSAEFSRDDSMLVFGSLSGNIVFWDVASDTLSREIFTGQTLLNVCFHELSSRVVSSSDDKTARIWDVSTGECMLVLEHPDQVNSVCFSEDGSKVITSCSDKTIKVWDSYTGEVLRTLDSRTGAGVLSFAYRASPKGTYI